MAKSEKRIQRRFYVLGHQQRSDQRLRWPKCIAIPKQDPNSQHQSNWARGPEKYDRSEPAGQLSGVPEQGSISERSIC